MSEERIAAGYWQGHASWDGELLQSKLDKRVHLKLELSFPLQVLFHLLAAGSLHHLLSIVNSLPSI